ncbi:purine catabolism regulatory protein [Geodermatophilus telluris]|uniref:Purine catabolism regulatory protein n=1 Tax=Geodermatophilus telluris TaxID=1190417 RepID=A0A1G6QFL4_9ACTN|nr:PucR family transcriptional regulator [Geodermatophilus telluris]SDC90951.1 purine catabolism regulatory protein [Geodermatophilus telluris]
MPVTVATLLGTASLELALHTRRAPVDRAVSWVHVSELADPTPFLEGGELLLTTGLALTPGDAPAYVRRLAGAGVVGLGLGTGLSHARVPDELVSAADESGLAVLEVPRQTPFIALSRTVSTALAAEEYAAVSRTSTVQRELTRAAVGPGAPGTVVDRLARHLGGWALLLDAAGTPLEAAPAGARSRAGALAGPVDRLRTTRPPAGAALTQPGETVLLQSLGTGSRVRGFLAVGRPGPFPAGDRHVVNAAALLLTLRLEQSRALDSGTAALRAAILQLLLAGQTAAAEPVVAALGERLPGEPVAAVAVLGSAEQRAAAVDVAADAAAATREPVLSAEVEDTLVVLVPAGGALAGRLADLPDRVPGTVLGTAGPVPWQRLADGVRQARQAAGHGRAAGRPVTAFADLAGRGLSALLDPAATTAFAEAALAPLAAADRAGPGDLVESLRVWLAAHGQWEPAAARLGVHRHTLRKRIRRAEELLGRDLDSPGVRAELWLALHPPTT